MTGIQITHYPGNRLEARFAEVPPSPKIVGGPGQRHGMKTITSFQNGWNTINIIGEIRSVDIPSLKASALEAFLRRPVRLVIDLSQVRSLDPGAIQWILETRQRIARLGGELKVVMLPNWPTARQIEFNLIE